MGTGGIIPWLVFAGIIGAIIIWDAIHSKRKD
jgi:hypothetical protein